MCTSKCSIRRGCWLAASRVSSLIAFLHPFLIKQQNDLEMCFQLEIFIWRVKKKSAAFTTIIRSTINIVMCYNTNLIQAAIYTYMYVRKILTPIYTQNIPFNRIYLYDNVATQKFTLNKTIFSSDLIPFVMHFFFFISQILLFVPFLILRLSLSIQWPIQQLGTSDIVAIYSGKKLKFR